MFKYVNIAALAALPAYACPERLERIGHGYDAIEIVALTEHSATVRYTNSRDNSSVSADICLSVGGIVVDVSVAVGTMAENDGREIVSVTPRGNYMAYPSRDEVADGDTRDILVALPMF